MKKKAPAPRCALDPDASAVSLDDAFGNGKSEPGAPTPCLGGLPKSVKDTGQVLGRDATPVSATQKTTSSSLDSRPPYTTASLREFDCVANEVLDT